MKLWWAEDDPVIKPAEFESHQEKLARMSQEVLRRYRRELDAEISDPARLAAVYGSGFATAEGRRQAEVVALLAASMLKVPSADVNVIWPDRQEFIAAVRNSETVRLEPVDIKESMCQHVIATGREFAVDQSGSHPLVCDTLGAEQGDIVSYLGVPISNRQGVIVGVLCVHSPEAREWKPADVSILTQLSFVLTRAMDSSK